MLALVACAKPELEVTDPRVRDLLPGTDKTVGYFEFHNATPEPVTIVAAKSEQVGAIEIHETFNTGDVVSMRRLDDVTVQPNSVVKFEPGGKHLMLFRTEPLTQSLVISLDVRTSTDQQRSMDVVFRVFGIGE